MNNFNQTQNNFKSLQEEDTDQFGFNKSPKFDSSMGFGFEQDQLGRLAEMNRKQVEDVMRATSFIKRNRMDSTQKSASYSVSPQQLKESPSVKNPNIKLK